MPSNSPTWLLAALLAVSSCIASSAAPTNCQGHPNTLPVFTGAPQFVSNVTNGKRYVLGETEPRTNIIQVYGTPYEMGFAHGKLLKDEINLMYPAFLEYIAQQINESLPDLPPEIRDIITKFGAPAALELTFALTKPFTPQRFIDEMNGLADGAGLDRQKVIQVHMFPELIKAHCSMLGAWGQASVGGSLYQLRALDWGTDSPLQQWPTVVVYHPTEAGHPFSIYSYAGFIGTLTGFSSAPMAVCEKVWLHYNGTSSRAGFPWHFLLREILQFDHTVDEAIARLSAANRTCSIFVGIGDPQNMFRVVEYSHSPLIVWDDTNFPVYENHPHLHNVLYVDKHTQPSSDPCLSSLLQQYYGSLNASAIIQVAALLQTGDLHIAVFDFAQGTMYVSNASPQTKSSPAVPAYDRAFLRVNMTALFGEAL